MIITTSMELNNSHTIVTLNKLINDMPAEEKRVKAIADNFAGIKALYTIYKNHFNTDPTGLYDTIKNIARVNLLCSYEGLPNLI